ncbi:zinc finger protein 276 isoform X2 [Callithrix jacchus]
MKRDRLGRFLSVGTGRQRGASGGGSGRARVRPSRSGGPRVDGAAARRAWGPAGACGDAGEDGTGEAARAVTMGHCRLCHGKFSSRSLRSISERAPGASTERPSPGERVLVRDFQRLLGVAVRQDPSLSQFVCKSCHAQFYQCHSLLKSFLQRINVSPTGHRKPCAKVAAQPPTGAEEGACLVDLITSSPQCLHGLVGWVHGHAASCRALPHLQRTLSSDYCGVIQAVWGCDQGHDYTMDSSSSCKAFLLDSTLAVKWPWDKETVPWLPQHRGCNPGAAPQTSQGRGTGTPVGSETRTLPSTDMAQPPSDSNPAGPRRGFPPQPSLPLCGAPGQLGEKQVPSSTSDDRVKDEFSDLSEGDFLSEDENDKKQNAQSSDESFEPYPERNISQSKQRSRGQAPLSTTVSQENPASKTERSPACLPEVLMLLNYEERNRSVGAWREIRSRGRDGARGAPAASAWTESWSGLEKVPHPQAPWNPRIAAKLCFGTETQETCLKRLLVKGVSGKKTESKEAKKSEEPRIRKKPGPKPGWKKKLRCEREELPTIYKCPYQGCTAVYRGADGMKKHIKEHHEEVRERPCPHPGCNKVFMIDRYLQRHVKLIHTEVRNYICDECGQTFKQRKHLLVHQMRHSGAKPLQCEVCGFQCRQRASLKYHMTKHKAETELDFACDQCGRRFEKAHNLNVHMSMVHPLTQTQDKALPLEAEPPPGPPSPSGTTEGQAVKPEPT